MELAGQKAFGVSARLHCLGYFHYLRLLGVLGFLPFRIGTPSGARFPACPLNPLLLFAPKPSMVMEHPN
jgi:hypothetical protein